jgi:hypothetical protein
MPPEVAGVTGEQAVLTTIEHYLVSLGESLHRAQERLSRLHTVAGPGGEEVVYQVPRLDFDFKIAMELVDHPAGPVVRMRSADGHAPRADNYVASAVRGSLVAVPVQGGRGRPVLRLQARGNEDGLRLTATVSSFHGEPIGAAELSFDVEAEAGALPAGVRFNDAVARSNANGVVVNQLFVTPAAAGAALSLRVAVADQAARLRWVVPRAAAPSALGEG